MKKIDEKTKNKLWTIGGYIALAVIWGSVIYALFN
jgi:hypothetical protein